MIDPYWDNKKNDYWRASSFLVLNFKDAVITPPDLAT